MYRYMLYIICYILYTWTYLHIYIYIYITWTHLNSPTLTWPHLSSLQHTVLSKEKRERLPGIKGKAKRAPLRLRRDSTLQPDCACACTSEAKRLPSWTHPPTSDIYIYIKRERERERGRGRERERAHRISHGISWPSPWFWADLVCHWVWSTVL